MRRSLATFAKSAKKRDVSEIVDSAPKTERKSRELPSKSDLAEKMMEIMERCKYLEAMDDDRLLLSSKTQGSIKPDGKDLLDSVIRVYCTHTEPNFSMPWQRTKQDFSVKLTAMVI